MFAISYGGRRIPGIGIGGPGDPDVYGSMSSDQQAWVGNTLVALNNFIVQSTGTQCPTWGAGIPQATGCFQQWYNANYAASGASKTLRTDGVFDQDTLCALQMIAGLHPTDFPTAFADPNNQFPCAVQAPAAAPPPAAPPAAGPPAAPPAAPTPPTAPPTAPPTTAVVPAKKLSTGAMVGIGVAAAAGVGGIIYAATRGGGKGRRRRR